MSRATKRVTNTTISARRPLGYWQLFRSTAVVQIIGGVLLFVFGNFALSPAGVVALPINAPLAVYAPWVVDGMWALLASLGWGCAVSVLLGVVISKRAARQSPGAASRTLAAMAVTITGYGPWLLTDNVEIRALASLLLLPGVLRGVAFDRTGRPRRVPRGLELSPLHVATTLAVSIFALALPYSLLHPFAVRTTIRDTPESISGADVTVPVEPGRAWNLAVGLQAGDFPLTVTAVRPVYVGSNFSIGDFRGNGHRLSPVGGVARTRIQLEARGQLWIAYVFTLDGCSDRPAGLAGISVTYRQLGLTFRHSVSLADNQTLFTCAK